MLTDKYREAKGLLFSDTLLSKSLRSGGILASASVVENALRFIRNIILARLLAPDAFGLIATVMAGVAMLEAFSEVGLRQSIIQNKKGSEKEYLNIIWWLSTIRGLAIYCMAWVAAPYIGEFFNIADSIMMLRAGFLVIPFNAMMSPRITVLEKRLQFKNWVFLIQGSAVAGIVIAIGSAFYFSNAWALIYGYVSEALFKFLLSYIFYPLIPTLELSRDHLKEIISFSRGMYGLPIMVLLFAQMDVIVIGRVLTLEVLGLYVLARSISDMPVNFFSKIAHPILLPSFAMLQDSRARLNKAILDTTNMMATLAMPLFAFLIIFSDILLSLFYGNIYATVAVPFSILCIYSFLYLSTTIIMSAFISIGKPHLQRKAAIARTCLFLIIIYPATKIYGLSGSAVSLLLATMVSLVIQIYYLKKSMDIGLQEYLYTWTLGTKMSLIVIIPGILLRLALDDYNVVAVAAGGVLCILSWGIGFTRMPLVREKLLAVNLQVT